MTFRLAAAPTLWNHDALPALTAPGVPYAQVLDEIAQLGYAGTELGAGFPGDFERLKQELDRRGLSLAGAAYAPGLLDASEVEAAFAALDPWLDGLQAAGCETLLVAEKPRAPRQAVAGRVQAEGGPFLSETQWQTLADALAELGRRARSRGLSLAFRPQAGSFVETATELKKLMNLTDPVTVGLCLDTGHLAYAGSDPVAVIETYWRRLRYVRLSDLDGGVRTRVLASGRGFHEALKARVFPELGTGSLALPRVLTALEAAGWSGWVVSAQETSRLSPLAAAKANVLALRQLVSTPT